jgi:hypothetical protein
MHSASNISSFGKRFFTLAIACFVVFAMHACTPSTDFDTPRTTTNAVVGTVAGATTGTVAGATTGTMTATAPPVITAFTPTSATTGTAVHILGSGFIGTVAVTFGGVAASSFTVISDTQILAVVASSGMSGSVSVITSLGTAIRGGLTVTSALISPTSATVAAAITAFTPTSGKVGTQVTITGSGFAGTSLVSFGGVPAASFMVVSNTQINAVVGNGSTGTVSVHTPSGILSSPGGVFTVLP